MRNKALIKEIKSELVIRFGELVSKVILFGSRIKGNARKYSDYDILIIINEQVDWRIKDQILDTTADIGLKYDILIDAHIISRPEMATIKGKQPFILKSLESGIWA